ncbi:MAG TPA: hypothetical protein VKB53_09225 [Gammaproteobacteria bacterium]|nr:hypothetical protein [Gammaproteobacteria bacterium]
MGQVNVSSSKHYGAITQASWGAIFAGAVIALVIQFGRTLLGLAVGLGDIGPNTGVNAMSSIGTGVGNWFAVSTPVSLYFGGLIAARMAGTPTKSDGAFHGVVVWALGTLLSFHLATSAVGSAVNGTLGQGLQKAGQGVTTVVPQAAEITAHVKAARLMVHQTAKEVKQRYREVQQQTEKIMAEGKQPVANTAKQGAPLVLSAALWTFIVLAAGVIAVAIGGVAGTPSNTALDTQQACP